MRLVPCIISVVGALTACANDPLTLTNVSAGPVEAYVEEGELVVLNPGPAPRQIWVFVGQERDRLEDLEPCGAKAPCTPADGLQPRARVRYSLAGLAGGDGRIRSVVILSHGYQPKADGFEAADFRITTYTFKPEWRAPWL